MDFYEELGISRTASEAEIRKSYKCLTLLLHPDQQRKPELRALADGQMKRINEIVAILTHPERRRIYDETLSEKTSCVRQIQPAPWIPWIRNNQGWVLVGVAFVLLLISPLLVPIFDSARSDKTHDLAAVSSASSSRAHEHGEPSPSGGPGESRLTSMERRMSAGDSKPAPGSTVPNSRLSAVRTGKPSSEEANVAPFPSKGVPDLGIATPPGPAQLATSPPLKSASPLSQTAPTLAGRWVYTPDPSDLRDPKLYPAEYVELSIAPEGSALRGVYQARYKLPSVSLNSRVTFTFEGPAGTFEGSAGGTSFTWRGDAGAQGEITIRLQSADTLQVNWFATKMGSALSLGSGNAILYRFR
jgi:DnaJ domain